MRDFFLTPMMELDSLAVDSSAADCYQDIMQGQHFRAVRTHYREEGNQMPVFGSFLLMESARESGSA